MKNINKKLKQHKIYIYCKYLLHRLKNKYLFILVNFYYFFIFLKFLQPIVVETFKLFMLEHGERLWRLYVFLVFIKIILFILKNFFF